MKTKILTSVAVVAAMMAASCDDNWTPPVGDDGQLDLSSVSIINDDAAKLITTEQQSRADIDVSPYIIEVYKSGETSPVETWTYGSMPEIVTLAKGDYTISVESHKVAKAEWERPYYKGSQSFSIATGKITKVEDVTCKFASVKVTITVADDLKDILADDATFTVNANDAGQLVYGKNEQRAGYFEAVDGSTTMTVEFKGTISGNNVEKTFTFTDVAAGQHRDIVFKTSESPKPPQPSGDVELGGVNIDVTYTDKDIDGNVTYEEEIINGKRPGAEDPKDPDDPIVPGEAISFKSETLDLDGINDAADFGEGLKPAKVTITSSEGITNLKVTINSETLTEAILSDVGLKSEFDLAEPGDLKEALEGLGLPCGSDVVGKKQVEFDITQFMSLLGIYGAANHNFTLDVVDTAKNEKALTLRFVTK